MVAMQMELESLKKDKDKDRAASEASSPEKELANALEHQTAALMKALEGRNQSQVMSVKTDLQWPTLGDERSDSKDVSEFYEHFEDNCGLANSCKGMNYREMLLALRSRCRGSRLKTFTNLYKSAYRAGEIEKDPEKVYKRIKAKHLLFTESPEEREIRVDAEHVALAKGKMTGHQFEPLFEASVTELETVGLGKSKRELYLSYLRKMPAHLQKEIRIDKRLWAGETQLRGPQTWEEAHRVVLEVEQREATHRATANAVYSTETERQQQPPKKEPKKPKEPKAPKQQVLAATEGTNGKKLCFHYRDHGTCPWGDKCHYSHDKELRKKALAEKKQHAESGSVLAVKGEGKGKGDQKGKGKGTGKGKGDSKGKSGSRGKYDGKSKKEALCPFFRKNGLQEGVRVRYAARARDRRRDRKDARSRDSAVFGNGAEAGCELPDQPVRCTKRDDRRVQ